MQQRTCYESLSLSLSLSYIFVGNEKGFWESSSDDAEHRDDEANGIASDIFANESKTTIDSNSELKSANVESGSQASVSVVTPLNETSPQQVSVLQLLIKLWLMNNVSIQLKPIPPIVQTISNDSLSSPTNITIQPSPSILPNQPQLSSNMAQVIQMIVYIN